MGFDGGLNGADITVLGAGVAGLAVARALALHGARVTVLEQADAIREVGAGLQISPNGAAVLKALGLEPALQAVSVRASAVRLFHGETGAEVVTLDLAGLRPGQGYHFLHRADLIEFLLQAAIEVGVELQLLQRIERVDLEASRPRLVTAQGAEREVDILIGADGLHSQVRIALNGKVAPFFTRQIAWRATIPCEPGAAPVAEVHMGQGRHLVSYPMRDGGLRNIVAVEERHRWVEEGWALRDDPMEMRLAFAGFSSRVRDWLDQAGEVWLWGLFRHPVARSWHRGRAAILGDAAHPTLPFMAQGANMALEDAWMLARTLAEAESVETGLATYQAARQHRVERVVEAANRNARNYHLRSPLREMAHFGLRAGAIFAPDFALRRFDWLYEYDVTA
ncbi:MAG: FAD-dependent monooxygenase [Pseudorhodobacter sp.]